ncbi:hypothetical protein [Mesorhizobium sp. ES1-1]|uniref:hypothetical protein n=1 Tax=Mesorhizobium sp. ES1-1 TaxID=2876629 RepID=UPI001CD030F1|nr:hypothetical protein [Mesorhizobium sp. ES1-1]MBZ9675249.1 hypothetical protein [Mesorhizobium sp. ES1-1]
MKDKRQLELNFNDPVEYLARPTYLGNTTRRASNCAPATLIVYVKTNVTVTAPQIGDEEGA